MGKANVSAQEQIDAQGDGKVGTFIEAVSIMGGLFEVFNGKDSAILKRRKPTLLSRRPGG